MKYKNYFFLILIFFFSCEKENELIGTYKAYGIKKSIDTLVVDKDYTYTHKVYSLSNEEIFIEYGRWEQNRNLINLIDLSINNDIREPKKTKKIMKENINLYLGKSKIWMDRDRNIYYKKVQ